MNVTLIACFFFFFPFDNMICWPDDRAHRILMKLLMSYRNLVSRCFVHFLADMIVFYLIYP